VLVTISNVSVPIYNRFHTRRANSGKLTSFGEYLSLTPSFEGNPFTQGHKILPHSKDFVILACSISI